MHGLLPVPDSVDRSYWQSGRTGVLSLQQCKTCRKVLFPPGRRCPDCASADLAWIALSGRGTIWSWVVFHRKYFPEMPPPYTVVRVQLAEGPFLITNLVDADERTPSIGAPVRVVFKQTGGLFLPQFRFE